MSSNKIIWLGSSIYDIDLIKFSGVSPAGNSWQTKFIEGLENNNFNVFSIGHIIEKYYPNGKLFLNKDECISPRTHKQIFIPYPNFYLIREIYLNLAYFIFLLRIIDFRKDIIISYNLYSYHLLSFMIFRFLLRRTWITIVADSYSASTDKLHPFTESSSKIIFLSYYLFRKSSKKDKIHFDGGVNYQSYTNNILNNKFSAEEKYILYSGFISHENGINLLIDAFESLSNQNHFLYLTGNIENEIIRNRIQSNNKIKYWGLVDRTTLNSLIINCTALINPRLISSPSNKSNFPSKLLEYLSSGKPIISTKTPGISNQYDDYIFFINKDSPIELSKLIDEVILMSHEKRLTLSNKIHTFITNEKNWSNMIKNIKYIFT